MLIHPLRVREGDLVAKNDQDRSGGSLEEQLASLDAMSGESAESGDEALEDAAPQSNPWTNTLPAPSFPSPQQPAPSGPPPEQRSLSLQQINVSKSLR